MKRNLRPSEVQAILKEYPDEKAAVLAEKYGVHVNKIYSTAKRYSVKKSEAFNKSEKSGMIKKGQHFSPNTQIKKGQRFRCEWKRREKKPHPTAWRKGNIGPKTAEDGAIRWRTIGWMIRIELNKWEIYSRWLWEKHHGSIPDGYNVIYRHGSESKKHIPTIDDLECLSNLELLNRNSGREALTDKYILEKLSHNKPELKEVIIRMPELIELKRNQLKLRRTINELEEVATNDR